MESNPFFGVVLHWIGGLAAGSFYVFFARVKHWAWEVYWLTGGLFSWIVGPWALGFLMTEDLLGVLARTPHHVLLLCWLFGALWGLGSLTAGLAIRYLGMSLGQGVTLGFCAAFGTLLPPLFKGQFATIIGTRSGQMVLVGVAVGLGGIAVTALAGLRKEREMPEGSKKSSILEYSFTKGMLVSVFAGIMSGFMSFGLDAGAPVTELSVAAGTAAIWAGLPKVVVILLGGFTSNVVCCVALSIRNGTVRQFLGQRLEAEPVGQRAVNYLFCAFAGLTWYLQYFFYTMGESQLGNFKFSSWTLHLASIIIFSTIWGLVLREWVGATRRARGLLFWGIVILVFSTIVIGYGNYLATSNARLATASRPTSQPVPRH